MKRLFLLIWVGILLQVQAFTQNYTAINGSSYAGSLGIQYNPAGMVNTPYKWDLTVFGTQLKSSTNAFTIYNYSLLSSPANSMYGFDAGEYNRYAKVNTNINLFNTRISLNRKHTIGFGVNIRNYTNVKTGRYAFNDTLRGSGEFFGINQNNTVQNATVINSGWAEIFASYGRTLIDNDQTRLNAGVTIKLSRGISGAYVRLQDGTFSRTGISGAGYQVTQGNLIYAYSSNFDRWSNQNSTGKNLANFVRFTEGGAAFDLGLEYMLKPREVVSYDDEDNYYDYDWKIGIAMLDIGGNQFKYGVNSRSVSGVKAGITNAQLDAKFDSTVTNLRSFTDTLTTIVDQSGRPSGNFQVINPARLILNVDRYITGNFFVNGELTINMPSSVVKDYLHVKDFSLLSITPRWETRKWGIYLPMQVNTENQFWVGTAFKAGPLLLGIHNWANVFSKTKMQNGGGYLALIFRAPGDRSKRFDKRLDCPKSIW